MTAGAMVEPMIKVDGLTKTFVLHTHGGVALPVLGGLSLSVDAGECVALFGPSGSGKSTLMRSLYANYKPTAGRIDIIHRGRVVDMVTAPPRVVLDVRRHTIAYVSQFLRVIPRVPTIDVVAEPLQAWRVGDAAARDRAAALLRRLLIPEALWALAPATFSGGEQQRVNVARSFVADYPIMLLDEPTAALDAASRDVVIALIREAKARGAAIVGIFHDEHVRNGVADRLFAMPATRAAA